MIHPYFHYYTNHCHHPRNNPLIPAHHRDYQRLDQILLSWDYVHLPVI